MSSVNDPTPLHATVTASEGHADHGDDHGHGYYTDWQHVDMRYATHSPYGLGHISSWQTLVKVWVALMALTLITVMAVLVNLGSLNIWIAMAIAVAKATLVVLYFMHMIHNKPFLAYVLTFSLAFVAFFLAMVMLDSKSYSPEVERRILDEAQIKYQITQPAPTAPATTPPTPAKTGH